MGKLTLLALVLIFTLASDRTAGQTGPVKTLAEFQGVALQWVNIAAPKFLERNLNPDKYLVTDLDLGDRVVVTLTDGKLGSVMGSPGNLPGYEVDIKKKDRSIISAHFMK
jgi:hypothetical protein